MTDIPLDKALIVWNLMEGKSGPPLKVVGGAVKDDDEYISSWGACNGEFAEANSDKKLRMLFAETVNLTVNEGIDPKVVHESLLVIPEYRAALIESDVIRNPEDQ